MDSRWCSSCRRFKSTDDFYRRGDGLQFTCKKCQRRSRTTTAGPDHGDGKFIAPASVRCVMCGSEAGCDLDNPYWINQYSDDMGLNQYSALCSAKCYGRLRNALYRMSLLLKLQRESDDESS